MWFANADIQQTGYSVMACHADVKSNLPGTPCVPTAVFNVNF